ncbi:MAG: sensor domain-containing diguanylate cyclase [Elusimicrobiota bacterium]
MRRVQESLFLFHKELRACSGGVEETAVCALRLLCAKLSAGRAALLRVEEGGALAAEACVDGGDSVDLGEVVLPVPGSPLCRLLLGKRKILEFRSPRPVLYLPLRREREEGVFRVVRIERSGGPFSREETAFARLLAGEVEGELRLAWASQESRERAARLKSLTELSGVFAGSMRMEDGLKSILRGISRQFGLDRVRLYLIDRASGMLRGELSADLRGRTAGLRGEEVPLEGAHRFARLLREDGEYPLAEPFRDRITYLPLAVGGKKTGLLVADTLFSQRTIAAADLGLLRSFADQIALAVDNARLFEEVQALSLYDGLTGLPVRRYFMQRFQEEIYRAERSGQRLSVALLDIDHFKAVNDTYGHQIGDAVLKEVGAAILRNLRKLDFAARYGGDELLILLPQAGEEEAVAGLGRLFQELRGVRVPVEFSKAGSLGVTLSAGTASYPEDGRTAEALIRRADEALYWVKSHGRDGLASFGRTQREQPGLPA